MFEIGVSLAAARTGQGLTPADAERMTCLRGRYLEALENDDFDALPGRTYARAFLRTYSDALGLDAEQFVDEFDARFPEPEEQEVAALQPVIVRRPINVRRLVAGVGVLAAIAAVVAWSNWPQHAPLPPVAPLPAAHATPSVARQHVLAADHTAVAPPKHFPLVIRATTGACWLQVRRGSATGAVLYEGLLEPGKTLTFGQRVWVRLGAPWNVAVHRGGHVPSGLPASAPVDLVA